MTEAPVSRLTLWTRVAMACGLVPTIAVIAGGASFGVAIWRGVGEHLGPALAPLAFVVLAPLGAGLALVAWTWFGALVARRSGTPPVVLMRADAWSWGSLIVLGFTSALPLGSAPGVTAGWLAAFGFAVGKAAVVGRADRAVHDALAAFLLTRIPIAAIAELSPYLVGDRTHAPDPTPNPWLAVWTRWDGMHYLAIARHGYAGTDYAFFPLYPLLIRILGPLCGSDVIAGMLISNVAFFTALVLFHKLVTLEFDAEAAHRAVVYLAVFPAAVFFSAVYTESLFLCLTLASFYALRRGSRVVAGVFGGLAAATRIEGVLLIVPYVIDVFASGDADLRTLAGSRLLRQQLALGAVFIGSGLVAFMGFVGVLTGNPLAFESVQSHWQRHIAAPWVGIERAFTLLSHAHHLQGVAVQAVELGFTVFAIAMLLSSFRLLRRDEWGYTFASLLLPLSTSSLMSMPRFAVVLFPLFAALAVWANRAHVHTAILLIMGPVLGMFTVLFANWYWIA